nr:Retrovirus-related Pol polyprotein from transposon RE1 [Ipomoea batatas]
MYVSGRGKDEYLTGEVLKPAETDATYRQWKSENHMVMSWLINSMLPGIGENFLLYHTAKEIWDGARDTYSSSENTSELFEIETKLFELKQGDSDVTQYYNTITRYWQHLDMFEVYSWTCPADSTLYKNIVEQKRTFRFLLGLNKDLDQVRGRIMSIRPFPPIRKVFSEVRREESRQKLMMADTTSHSEISAMLTHTSSHDSRPRKGGRPWCEHCKKAGHFRETCWKIHGKPADWKPKHHSLSILKALDRTSSDMAGSVPNISLAMVITPGFWLFPAGPSSDRATVSPRVLSPGMRFTFATFTDTLSP